MRQTGAVLLLCVWAAGCGETPRPAPAAETAAKPSAPAIPQEVQDAATAVLGAESEALAFGNLAGSGREQALVINRLPTTPQGVVPGNLLTRAVVIERDGEKWKEVFRCDEYLKNAKGYLGGTPILPVTGWRLSYERSDKLGLVMYFTPLVMPGGGSPPTIAVRWNEKVKRYQSLDRNFENFLGEVPSIERIPSRLR